MHSVTVVAPFAYDAELAPRLERIEHEVGEAVGGLVERRAAAAALSEAERFRAKTAKTAKAKRGALEKRRLSNLPSLLSFAVFAVFALDLSISSSATRRP